jgi:hypothetical protein
MMRIALDHAVFLNIAFLAVVAALSWPTSAAAPPRARRACA